MTVQSAIDYMVYTRCASDGYDQFAAIAGDDGWTWDNLFPYIIKAGFLRRHCQFVI